MIWLTLLVSLAWGADNTYDKIRLDRIDISVRQLQKGRPTITGTPTFQNGMSWGAGTTETTGLTGAIFLYASSTTPTGWLECDGSSYLTSTYTGLYAAIGCNWGCADGTHFNVPDLRGTIPRGWNHSASTDTLHGDQDASSRSALKTGGATGDNVGSYQADAVRAHTHTYNQPISNDTVAAGGTLIKSASSSTDTGSTGGNETRPKNAYVMYIIKY